MKFETEQEARHLDNPEVWKVRGYQYKTNRGYNFLKHEAIKNKEFSDKVVCYRIDENGKEENQVFSEDELDPS